MKAELMMEMAEQKELEVKAEACDELFVLLHNAIGFMREQGMSNENIAEYLGTTIDILDAIEEEDAEAIIE